MKRQILFTLVLLPFIAACNSSNKNNNNNSSSNNNNNEEKQIVASTDFSPGKNVQTRNYKNVEASKIHPEVDDGYTRINSVLINSERFIDVAEDEITYLYKLSCKNSSDSFKTHKITCDSDGFYYAEIRDTQHDMIPNGFDILKNNNNSGSSVEISIVKIYKCFSYRELYYSETEKKIKVVDFDHVIPGLEESAVNSLIGKSVDYSVYVDESGIKTMNYAYNYLCICSNFISYFNDSWILIWCRTIKTIS